MGNDTKNLSEKAEALAAAGAADAVFLWKDGDPCMSGLAVRPEGISPRVMLDVAMAMISTARRVVDMAAMHAGADADLSWAAVQMMAAAPGFGKTKARTVTIGGGA